MKWARGVGLPLDWPGPAACGQLRWTSWSTQGTSKNRDNWLPDYLGGVWFLQPPGQGEVHPPSFVAQHGHSDSVWPQGKQGDVYGLSPWEVEALGRAHGLMGQV